MKVTLLQKEAEAMKGEGKLADPKRYEDALAFIEDEEWVKALAALTEATAGRWDEAVAQIEAKLDILPGLKELGISKLIADSLKEKLDHLHGEGEELVKEIIEEVVREAAATLPGPAGSMLEATGATSKAAETIWMIVGPAVGLVLNEAEAAAATVAETVVGAGEAPEPEPEEALREELSSYRVTQLLKRAASSGVSEEEIEAAEDAEDHKLALIEVIIKAEEVGVGVGVGVAAKPAKVKVKASGVRTKNQGNGGDDLGGGEVEKKTKAKVKVSVSPAKPAPVATAEPDAHTASRAASTLAPRMRAYRRSLLESAVCTAISTSSMYSLSSAARRLAFSSS